MFKLFTLIAYVAIHSIISNEAARILGVFPTPSISHQIVFRPLIQELVKNGHQVVVITTDPAFPKGGSPTNLTEIDVHDLSYKIWKDFMVSIGGRIDNLNELLKLSLERFALVFEKQIQTKEIKRIIEDKNQHFDLLLIEACVRPALVFSHLYKVPTILVSSYDFLFNIEASIGMPTHPLLYPSILSYKDSFVTFRDKLMALYTYSLSQYWTSYYESIENKMVKRYFGPATPNLNDMYNNNVDMVILNVNPIWKTSRPTTMNVIYMGSVHIKPEKELPKDLKFYLDSSAHGVIYMSFGTNTKPSLLPPEKIQTIISAFSQLPYDILWKWDKDELPGRSKNIRISKWFPQSDLLRHPKIKLFITQGGLQSTDEAIIAGVPLLGIPMLADQWYNVEKYVMHKIGVRLDLESLTESKLMNAINTVIENKSYRQNIEKLRSLMHDQPQSPLDRAVWWTEHVLQHGGARHLRAPAANMSWAQYFDLEFIFTLLISFFVIIFITVVLLYYIVKFVIRKLMSGVKLKKN